MVCSAPKKLKFANTTAPVARIESVEGLLSTRPDRGTALGAAVAGACAFLATFAVTFVIEGRRVLSPDRPLLEFYVYGTDAGSELNLGPTGPLPGPRQFAAWQFLSLHGTGFERRAEEVWTLAPPETRLLVFVPAAFLMTAGAAVVWRRGAEDPRAAVRRGGAVALGYLPLVVLLTVTSQWAAPESVAIKHFGITAGEPEPIGVVDFSVPHVAPIAGLAYPVGFGGLGGYLAFVRQTGHTPVGALRRGAVAGVAAFLVGWAFTLVRSHGRASRVAWWEVDVYRIGPGEHAFTALDFDMFSVATWQFHRIHGGNIEIRYLGPVSDGIDAVFLPPLALGPTVFSPSIVFVPLLLAFAGAIVARRSDATGYRHAAAAGATVAVGYLPLSLATALLVTVESTGAVRAVVGVELVDAFLLTGLALPVMYGALGGVVGRVIATAATGGTRTVERFRS